MSQNLLYRGHKKARKPGIKKPDICRVWGMGVFLDTALLPLFRPLVKRLADATRTAARHHPPGAIRRR